MTRLLQRQISAGLHPELDWNRLQVHIGIAAALERMESFLKEPWEHAPLILYGRRNSGKSHLLHAFGNRLVQQDPSLKICCQDARVFKTHWRNLAKHRPHAPRRYYLDLEAALIDDIQHFHASEDDQERFFPTMGQLVEWGRWVVFTCDENPLEMTWKSHYAQQLIEYGTVIGLDL